MTTTAEPTTCPSWCVVQHVLGETAHESQPVTWEPDPMSNTDLLMEIALAMDPTKTDVAGSTLAMYVSAPGDGLMSLVDAKRLAYEILERLETAGYMAPLEAVSELVELHSRQHSEALG
jgi:hypothetical protein